MSTAEKPVALVTGAAGGLGQELVSELVRQGWRVAAGWHRTAPPEQPDVLPVALDVTSGPGVAAACQEVLAGFGRVDLLVNNAGLAIDRPVWDLSEADWDQVMAVNVQGARRCAQAVLPGMCRQRAGHIVNVASFAARSGPRGQGAYAAAKAALIGLTQSLAREVGPRNVRVNAVLPGVLPTAMTAGLPPGRLAEFAASNALGRINSVAEVARCIAFLATTTNISGQVFQLDSRIAPWT